MEYISFLVMAVILLSTTSVSSIDFTISMDKILITSAGTLTMSCRITETDLDTDPYETIRIGRLRSNESSGSNSFEWKILAYMTRGDRETPSLSASIEPVKGTKDYVAGGSWNSTTPANTYLTLSMNIEKLVCDDARYYRCELTYRSSTTAPATSVAKNATFSAFVKPKVTSLIARKNGVIVQGSSSNEIAPFKVGNELELSCTSNIGSLSSTIIQWQRTSENSSNDEFIEYHPAPGTFNDGTATSDNQCGYIRVATIKYNTTTADANRKNHLAFQCYVTVSGDPYGASYTSENNLGFYADVTKSSENDGTRTSAISLTLLICIGFSAILANGI